VALTALGRSALEFPEIGHAPALMDPTQIAIIAEFLRPLTQAIPDSNAAIPS
jgi:hypothetical protein